MNLNKVILIGRIASDINIFDSRTGVSYVRFSLAVTRDNYSNEREEVTDFISIVAFRNNATFISKYFNKGDLVNIVGMIQSSQYTSKNGDLVFSTNVVVDQIKALEPKQVVQARMEKNNTTLSHENKSVDIKKEPSFFSEEKNEETKKAEEEKDSPWELDF